MPHNLPVPATPFVGRQDDIQHIVKLLDDHRLITIVGMGGIGKTRLSIEVGHALSARDVFFVSLAPILHPHQVVEALAEALGTPLSADEHSDMQLANELKQSNACLIFDNFEHVMDAASLIQTLIDTCPTLSMIVTSRERLNVPLETVYPITGFALPHHLQLKDANDQDAIRLFIQLAEKVDWNFRLAEDNLPEILAICQQVDGVPLAIELAAAWSRMMSPRAILKHLKTNLNLLADSLSQLPERHRSIRAVFESSWQLLSADEQHIYSQLSIFRGGFTQNALADMFNATPQQILSLIDKSLLYRDENHRLTMHELLREYAQEKLADYPHLKQTLEHRHARYFADFLQQHSTFYSTTSHNRGDTMQEIVQDLDNIREAWSYAISHADFELIKQTVETIYHIYRNRGDYMVGFNLLQEAISLFDDPSLRNTHRPLYIQLIAMCSIFAEMIYKQDLAFQYATEAHQLATDLKLTAEIARSELALCIYYIHTGDLEMAQKYGESAILHYQVVDNIEEQTSIYINLGWTYQLLQQFDRAEQLFLELVAINEPRNNLHEVAQGTIWLALVNNIQQRFQTAKTYGLRAHALFTELGIDSYAGAVRKNLAISYWGLDNYHESRKYFIEALDLYTKRRAIQFDGLLGTMVWIAHLMHSEGASALAVEVCEFVRHHPSVIFETLSDIETLYPTLENALPEVVLETAQDRGRTISDNRMIDQLYAYLQPSATAEATHTQTKINNLSKIIKERLTSGNIPSDLLDDPSQEITTTIVQYVEEVLEAEKAKMMSRFMENASHDLRTPITIINSSLYLLEHIQDPDRQKDKLNLVKNQVQHLHDIIESLLLMSRLDSGIDFEFREVNIVPLVRATCIQMERQLEQLQLNLQMNLPDTPIKIQADIHYLQLTLENILDNACHHTPAYGTITVNCEIQQSQATIVIQDTGQGIPPEHIPYVFDRFYRVDVSRTNRGRSGLGLAIVKQIVQAHNGTCTITSELNQGCAVAMNLPLI